MDSTHAVAKAGLSRELFYVAMTRGRQANHAYVDFGVDHEAHSPDEWGLLTEMPPAGRPVTVLEGVLKRESAEHTAHEVRDAQRAWANDLGRMVHELDYLNWAARSARTHEWVQDTYGDDPEAVARLTDAVTWPQLVKADPALHHQGNPEADDAVPEILTRCAPRGEEPALAAPEHQPASQREVTVDLVARIHHELDGRMDRIEVDPPAWYDELAQHHLDPADRRAAAADVLVWRAVSGQDDADTALGKAPTEKDATARYPGYYGTAGRDQILADNNWERHVTSYSYDVWPTFKKMQKEWSGKLIGLDGVETPEKWPEAYAPRFSHSA